MAAKHDWNREPEMFEVMLKRGANVNARDYEDNTPLHYAAKANFKEIYPLISGKEGSEMALINAQGKAPLHLAVEYGSTDIVKLFLEDGIDLGVPDDAGNTPLSLAITSPQGNM